MKQLSQKFAISFLLTACIGFFSFNSYPQTVVPEATDLYDNIPDAACSTTITKEIDKDGSFYMYLWLLPAKMSDGSFAVFDVTVNNAKVGTISPKRGNWQLIGLDRDNSVNLQKGIVNIKIRTRARLIPQVERIEFSPRPLNPENIETKYDCYLDSIKQNCVSFPEEEDFKLSISSETGRLAVSPANSFKSEKLKPQYSYFTIQYFEKGEDITLTSSSEASHILDFQIYGKPDSGNFYGANMEKNTGSKQNSIIVNPPGIIGDQRIKPAILHSAPTPAERQGLGWFFPSEKANNSQKQLAIGKIKIPMTGYYLIQLRTTKNGVSSVADLNINGSYFYEDMPISLCMTNCIIPADGNEYTAIASTNSYRSDPVMFILGADAERLVGFNDDCYIDDRNKWSLKSMESCLSQAYNVVATKVCVTEYYSDVSTSECVIEVFSGTRSTNSPQRCQSPGNNSTSDVAIPHEERPCIIRLGNAIMVNANKTIRSVSVATIDGVQIMNLEPVDNNVTIPSDELREKGIYIITIVSEDGDVYSDKLLIS